MKVADKIVIVTGGASGIGKAMVERFHKEGAKALIVADLNGAGAEAVAKSVGGIAVQADVTKEADVQKIVNQMQEGTEKPRHKVEFEVGEYVRVKEGPFTDFNGTVEEVNYEKSKMRVSVTIFGRATPVELEFAQVEKA